jgi:hypothetical protein
LFNIPVKMNNLPGCKAIGGKTSPRWERER